MKVVHLDFEFIAFRRNEGNTYRRQHIYILNAKYIQKAIHLDSERTAFNL